MSKHEKTKTVSFRVPEHIMFEIEKDAKSKLISANSVVNEILLHYVTWDRYQQRAKMYPIPKENLIHVLDILNDSQQLEAIDYVYNAIRDHALLSKKKFDIHSCLESVQDYCRVTGIPIEDNVVDGKRVYTINHELGLKFSTVIQKFVEKLFWELVKIKIDTITTNNTVVISLKDKID